MLIVFGSLNTDLMYEVAKLPMPGETVLAAAHIESPGGKGANQAFAAVRSAARTAMIGCVGRDNSGKYLKTRLRRAGVMTTGVGESEQPTGAASIIVDAAGENQIVVAPGANLDTSADQVPDEILIAGNVVLAQMEVPPDETAILLKRAKAGGAKTILNFAPAGEIGVDTLGNLDYFIANEIEIRQCAAFLNVESDDGTAVADIARNIARKHALTCVVTLGGKGAIACRADAETIMVPALKVEKIVDCTGAGDVFCGTFAASVHAGLKLEEAMRRASVAGSLTCTKKGTQDACPYLSEIEDNLEKL